MHQRRWTDTRDGRRWTITHNPAVELARPKERALRSRIVFESEDGEKLHAEAVYGTALATLSEADLQGLLDQAREGSEGGEAPRSGEEP